MMSEMEYLFTECIYNRLKERVRGKVTTYIVNNVLTVRVVNFDDSYVKTIDDISRKVCLGYGSKDIVDEFVNEYREFIMKKTRKKYVK